MNNQLSQNLSRRRFIKRASIVVAALPVLPLGAMNLRGCADENEATAQSECEWCGSADAPARAPSKIVITPPGEAGEPLVISGTVYKEDGKTPAEGILLYVYHTNAEGIYPKREPNNGRAQWRHGYLRGWMRTGIDGKYEFRTIKPSGYPGRSDPAHIHITVSGAGLQEYWIDDYWFEGDARLTSEMRAGRPKRGGFSPIITLKRDDKGVWQGRRDIKLERI